MFERAEVRRGGRAVSFALAAVAHGVLLLAAFVLVRKQVPAEPLPPIVHLGPLRGTEKPAPGRDTSSGRETRPTRHRPRPRPADHDRVVPPPAPAPDIAPQPEVDESPDVDSEREQTGEGSGPIGKPSGETIGGDCMGPDCGQGFASRPVEEVRIGEAGVERPRALCDPPAPRMPEQARIMSITGAVVMRYVVEPDGSVTGIQLLNHDAAPVLVEAVRDWLAHCRFTPAVANGKQVRIRWDRQFFFKLQ
jgi:TonB family protein